MFAPIDEPLPEDECYRGLRFPSEDIGRWIPLLFRLRLRQHRSGRVKVAAYRNWRRWTLFMKTPLSGRSRADHIAR